MNRSVLVHLLSNCADPLEQLLITFSYAKCKSDFQEYLFQFIVINFSSSPMNGCSEKLLLLHLQYLSLFTVP